MTKLTQHLAKRQGKEIRRPANQQNRVALTLRRKIVNGDYQPGEKLPPRQAIAEEFGVSIGVAQRAMSWLEEDGFIYSSNQGSMVAEDLPCHRQVGLVMLRPDLPDHGYVQFWRAIVCAANDFDDPTVSFAYYYIKDAPDGQSLEDLEYDVLSQRLLGFYLIDIASYLYSHPVMNQTKVPFVVTNHPLENMVSAHTSFRSDLLIEHQVARMREKGAQSLLFMVKDNKLFQEDRYLLETAFAKHGYKLDPRWIILMPSLAEGNYQLSNLLLSHPDCPDGWVILDDNLIPPVTRAISEHQAKVHVNAHANFPAVISAHVQADYVGFDAQQILKDVVCWLRMPEDKRAKQAVIEIPPYHCKEQSSQLPSQTTT